MNVRDAIALAAHVVGGKGPVPILAYLRIAGGRIVASDTTQQIDIPLELPKGIRGADFCVHAGRFLRMLNALPAELELDLQHKGKLLTIKAGPTTYELNTLPPEDYPLMADEAEQVVQLEAQSKPFVAALKFAARAMARNDIRYYLNGVHYQLRAGKLVLTGTDGHRLHRARVELTDADLKAQAEGIIAAASVARVIEVAEQHTEVSIDASATRFNVTHKETLWTKLIDGKFPDAERVIPADRLSTGGIPRKPFLAAVQRVAQIFAASGDKVQGVLFAFTQDDVTLSGRNSEGDTAKERFEWNAADKKFDGVAIGMDWQYVAEAFDALTEEWAFLHLPTDEREALYITDGAEREVVIMPMRI